MTISAGYWLSTYLVSCVSITLLFYIDIMLTRTYDKGIILLVSNVVAFAVICITTYPGGKATEMAQAALVLHLVILITMALLDVLIRYSNNERNQRIARLGSIYCTIMLFIVLIMSLKAASNEKELVIKAVEDYLRNGGPIPWK